jgi:hypothetical protein
MRTNGEHHNYAARISSMARINFYIYRGSLHQFLFFQPLVAMEFVVAWIVAYGLCLRAHRIIQGHQQYFSEKK